MQDLTTGPVTRHLLRTTSFMLVTMVFQTLYFLIDLYWVGRLGKEAVAGVGVAGNLTFVVLAISQMLGVGTTALVAHAAGRKDQPQALLVFKQSQGLSMLVAAGFFVVFWSLRTRYARGLAADDAAAQSALDYLRWYIPAMALQFGVVAMGAALRGTGNFRPGMIVGSATIVINILLAPVLIFGWGTGRAFGVAGAAMSTLVAVLVGTVWLLAYFLLEDSYLRITPGDWAPRLDTWRQVLRIGLPAGAEFLMMGVYMVIVYAVTRPFGSEAQAGFGIGQRIVQAGFMPVVALGFAVAPVAGQNVGAGLPHRVRATFRSAALMASGGMLLFAFISHLAPAAMVRVFSADPHVVEVGADYLRIISWTYVASGLIFISASMFQAMGNTLPSLAASLIRVLLVGAAALALSRRPDFALWQLWYVAVLAAGVQLVVALWLLRREFGRRLGGGPA
jgi:putative MATE family efflux protein